jgi:hypothetical protein
MNGALKNSAGKSLNDPLAPIIVRPETRLFSSPSMGEGEGGVIMARNFKTFYFYPPHPAPLPLGERGFPDEH